MNKQDRLQQLLNNLNCPEKRKADYKWLSRNLCINNTTGEALDEAVQLIKELLKEQK